MAELNYHHLRYFHAVAHEGHLTRAAEKLNVSQSALSAQIGQLEERLGQKLFERRGRALHLTEAGRIALDHADAIFASGRELLQSLSSAGTGPRVLRVGAIATLSRNFQLAFLKPLLGRSDVEIIVRSGSEAELFGLLDALNLDLVLSNQAAQSTGNAQFVNHRVDEQPISLIGTREMAAIAGDMQGRLTAIPVILPTAASGYRAAFDALVARLGISLQVAAEVDDMAMLRLLAREGAGLAVIPPIVVRDEIESGLLVEFDRMPGVSEVFYAVTVQRRFPNPLIEELLESGMAEIDPIQEIAEKIEV